MYYVLPFDQPHPSASGSSGSYPKIDPIQSLTRSIGFFLPLILALAASILAYLYLQASGQRENYKNLLLKMQLESDRIQRHADRRHDELFAELYVVKSGLSTVLSKVVDGERNRMHGIEDDEELTDEEEEDACHDDECKKSGDSSADQDSAMAELLSKIQ